MGEACRAFETPVTGGNVSFYNQSPEGAVFPTPTICMLGLIEYLKHVTTSGFNNDGDVVFLIHPQGWRHKNDLRGSPYLASNHGPTHGDALHFAIDQAEQV